MITLKLEDVKVAARKAYHEGRLSAQAPKPVCQYRSKQNRTTYACAIGAALTDEQVTELLEPGDDVGDYKHLNICALSELAGRWTADEKDIGKIEAIQDAHDEWVGTVVGNRAPTIINSARDNFARLIDADASFL